MNAQKSLLLLIAAGLPLLSLVIGAIILAQAAPMPVFSIELGSGVLTTLPFSKILDDEINLTSPATFPPDEVILFTNGQNLGGLAKAIALGNLNKDDKIDIFIGHSGANKVWWNDGAGAFTANGQSLGTADSWAVVLGDLDGDDDLDAFVANYGQADKVWLNNGAGAFSEGQSLHDSAWSRAVALGDVNGDGHPDALVGGASGGRVWLNNGKSIFSSGQALIQSDSWAVALADLDGDDDLDAFIGDIFRFKIWLNTGTGAFYDSGQDVDSSGSKVAMGDVDGDGDIDALIGACCFDPNEVWLNTGEAIFIKDKQNLGLGDSQGSSVVLGDVDGDCDLDALLGTANGGQVWVNGGQSGFTEDDQSLGSALSKAVALGDVDGDDDLDALVGSQIWLNQSPQVDSRGCLSTIYLPFILKSPLPTYLYAQNIKAGIATVKIRDPNNGDALLLTCAVENNLIKFCGTFPAIGTYKVVATATNCELNPNSKIFNDALPGTVVTRTVFCP